MTSRQKTIGTTLFDTPFGSIRAFWTTVGLRQLEWPARQPDEPNCGEINDLSSGEGPLQGQERALQDWLTGYFAGNFWNLPTVQIDRTDWSPFFAKVYTACQEIIAGNVVTYGQLAISAGSPQGARAVGQAMARNRLPLLIPCHRVIGGQRGMGGYSGPGGIATKGWLLRHEGVPSACIPPGITHENLFT